MRGNKCGKCFDICKCLDEFKTKRLYVINMTEDIILRFDDNGVCSGVLCGLEVLQSWAEVHCIGKTKQNVELLLDGKDLIPQHVNQQDR